MHCQDTSYTLLAIRNTYCIASSHYMYRCKALHHVASSLKMQHFVINTSYTKINRDDVVYLPPAVVSKHPPSCLLDNSINTIGKDTRHGSPVLHSIPRAFEVPPGIKLGHNDIIVTDSHKKCTHMSTFNEQ